MKRRGFLQQVGSMLAALGLSEVGLGLLADHAGRVLAQPARRKLALLVGIDRYPETVYGAGGFPLTGCATDVQLQRELLIHRFGFQPGDILTLTNEQATRSQIETALITHLKAGTQGDDLVVFHFSGYGSRIPLSDGANSWQNSLVPVDGGLSTQESGIVKDLPAEILWQILRSLPTDRVLTVLDTSYLYPVRSLPGTFRIRSCPNSPLGQLPASAFPNPLQGDAYWHRQVPGIVLSAASSEGWAMEAQWQGFSAGLFTYALTQQLWQTTDKSSIQVSWQQAACQVKQWAENAQHPQLCRGMAPPCATEVTDGENLISSVLFDFLAVGSDGVVLGIDPSDRMARIWLAGLPAHIVESYGSNSLLAIAPTTTADASPTPLLQVRTREGLTVKAQILASSDLAPPQAGQLVWEMVRVLPRHVNLTVALDGTLERIERVDATSALAALRNIAPVPVGEQSADCLFGRVQPSEPGIDAATTPRTVRGGYGLLSPLREVIPGSVTDTEEAVKTAIGRLSPQLDRLRAAKLLRSIANQGSSQLGMKATLTVVDPEERVFLEKWTARATGATPGSLLPISSQHDTGDLVTLPALSRIRYRLQNLGDRPLYFIIFGFDPDGRTSMYYPLAPDIELHHRAVPPGEMAIVPSSSEGWLIGRMRGMVTIQIVSSTLPFTATLAALEAARVPKSNRLETIANPLDLARAIVEDLHQASLPMTQNLGLSKEVFALDVNNWATLSLMLEVV
jgi:Caspase domain